MVRGSLLAMSGLIVLSATPAAAQRPANPNLVCQPTPFAPCGSNPEYPAWLSSKTGIPVSAKVAAEFFSEAKVPTDSAIALADRGGYITVPVSSIWLMTREDPSTRSSRLVYSINMKDPKNGQASAVVVDAATGRIISPAQPPVATSTALGGFTLSDTQRFLSGSMIRYLYTHEDGTAATVDVSRMTAEVRSGGSGAAAQARAVSRNALTMLEYEKSRGTIGSFRVIADSAVTVAAGGTRRAGWFTEWMTTPSGGDVETRNVEYIFPGTDALIRVRAELPAGTDQQARITTFAAAALNARFQAPQ